VKAFLTVASITSSSIQAPTTANNLKSSRTSGEAGFGRCTTHGYHSLKELSVLDNIQRTTSAGRQSRCAAGECRNHGTATRAFISRSLGADGIAARSSMI
jgi:hypothetical protein